MWNLKNQRLLVIAPHPDDEVLGCGGLITRIKEEKGKVYVLFLCLGDTKDFSKKGHSSATQRQKEIKKVARFLRFDGYDIGLPENDKHLKLDLVGQKKLMDVIERETPISIEKLRPTIVALPSSLSYNQDHRVAAYATHAALRGYNRNLKHFVPFVISYEQPADFWSLQTPLNPNFFLSLSSRQIKAKLAAMKLYSSQDRPSPNPRSRQALKSLALIRGTQAGSQFAEGFLINKLAS